MARPSPCARRPGTFDESARPYRRSVVGPKRLSSGRPQESRRTETTDANKARWHLRECVGANAYACDHAHDRARARANADARECPRKSGRANVGPSLLLLSGCGLDGASLHLFTKRHNVFGKSSRPKIISLKASAIDRAGLGLGCG